jgi:hypothetical protein
VFCSLLFFPPSEVAKSHHRKKLFFLSIEPMLAGSSFFREPLVQVLTPKKNLVVFLGVAPSLILLVLASFFNFNNPQAQFENWVRFPYTLHTI